LNRGRWARLCLSTLLGVAFLWLLFRWSKLEPQALWESWKRLSPVVALEAFAVHVAIYFVRSQRFRVLLPLQHRPSGAAMLAVSAAHNLAAYVLPAKTGEVTLVMYLRAAAGVPATDGLAALLVSRLLDLATLSFALALATLQLVLFREPALPGAYLGLSALLLGGAALLMLLSARSDVLVVAAAWGAKRLGAARANLGLKLLARAEDLALALRRAPAGRVLWVATGQSLLMWFLIFLFYGILARGFGLPEELGLSGAAFGSGLAVLSNLLPINSFAGFGTQEGGWLVGFGLLGVPRDLALSTGLGVHLAQLASTVFLGLLGHVAMGWFRTQGRAPDPGAVG
jgi:uncharacterized protein (TIRG00374 family)